MDLSYKATSTEEKVSNWIFQSSCIWPSIDQGCIWSRKMWWRRMSTRPTFLFPLFRWPFILKGVNLGFPQVLRRWASDFIGQSSDAWGRAISGDSLAPAALNRQKVQKWREIGGIAKTTNSLSVSVKGSSSQRPKNYLSWHEYLFLKEKQGRNYLVQYWLLEERNQPDFWVFKRMSENYCVEVFKAHYVQSQKMDFMQQVNQ